MKDIFPNFIYYTATVQQATFQTDLDLRQAICTTQDPNPNPNPELYR